MTGRPRLGFHSLHVADVTPLTDDAVTIRFAVPPDLADAYAHAPGQYLTIRTSLNGQRLMRRYSICAPAGSGTLQIGVKRRRGGLFSNHAVDELRAGDVLDVMTPMGGFTAELEPQAERHHVGVAVGSGITPLRSISMSVLAHERRSRVTLIYANRTRSSTMFRTELDDLRARQAGRFDLVHVLEDGPADGAVSGRLDPDLLAAIAGPRGLLPGAGPWYLSGPYDLVEALRDRLVEAGVDAAAVRTESFLRPETAPPEPRRQPVSSA
jgi:ring-1,2-phenylacetyl-CoA epoxidase subunit PaaE